MVNMSTLIVGVGEGLGLYENELTGLQYAVRVGGKTYPLDEKEYKLWKVAKMSEYKEEQFGRILEYSDEDVSDILKRLFDDNLVLHWNSEVAREIFSTHIIIPKGMYVKKEGDNYLFGEIRKSSILTIHLVPTTIWRIASPFLSIEEVKERMVEVLGLSEGDVEENLLYWVPFLNENGLLTIDKVIYGG